MRCEDAEWCSPISVLLSRLAVRPAEERLQSIAEVEEGPCDNGTDALEGEEAGAGIYVGVSSALE